jgi:curved DNA-binding protein CbpA
MRDFYEVLQVHPRAEADVIRAAYRTLARKYHPDHGGDALRMIALNDAWDVLGDPSRRAAYDASRIETESRPPTPAAPVTGAPAATGTSTANGAPAAPGAPRQPDATHAGPPPGHPSGTVLDFGRYAGWSLGEIARYDTDYLEWLLRATFGRRLRAEIETLLRQRAPASGRAQSGQQWNRRR